MRESLTILAILLIVVLTTALVGPYFVDWNSHRAAIEARLSTLLDARVTVGGPIDVKLLPRPIFRLADVTVTGPTPRAPTASVARLDVELALTSLLAGEFVFVDADLTAPRLTLVMGEDGALVLPRFAATDPDHVSLSHVALHDGAVLVVGEDGRPVIAATGLAGDGEAESLVGPFRFTGQTDGPHGVLPFRVNTGAIDGGKVRLKSTLEAAGGLPRTDIEGIVALTQLANGASQPRFDGSVAAADALPLAGTDAVVPWRLSGHLNAEKSGVEVTGLELRAGAEGRALVLGGKGRIDLGAKPKAAFTMHARQADLPRFAAASGAEDERAVAAANAAAILGGLRAVARDPDLLSGLPVPVSVDVLVDAVTLGHLTLSRLAGHVALEPRVPISGSLSIGAPDGSHLGMNGSLETGPAAVFKGRVEARTHDLGRLADSIAPDLPEIAQALRGALPARGFEFTGALDLSGIGFAAHDAELTLDGSRFAGTITLTRSVGSDRARLFADLTSDALDLDALPDWRDSAGAAAELDLSVSLAARAVRLAQSDTGRVETGRMTLQLSKLGSAVTLDRLSLADIGGATADLTGHSDGRAAHVEGRLDARRLRDLLALARRLAPGRMAERLLARADALSPALLTVAADAAFDGNAQPRLSRMSVDGTLAGTSLVFRLGPDGSPSAAYRADLTLEAPEAGALLRQFGVATLPSTAVGRSRLDVNARLDAALAPLDLAATATLSDTVLTLKGRRNDAGDFAGDLTVKGGNAAPLLRAVTLANPEEAAAWPVDATASLMLSGPKVSVGNLAGTLMGTTVRGALTYVVPSATAEAADAPEAPAAALTGTLSVGRLPLPVLASLALGPLAPPRAGALWSESAFTPVLANLPRTEVGLEVAAMPLVAGLAASGARMDLKAAPGLVTLSGLSARVGDGRIGGTFELRRNAQAASLSGHAAWSDLPSASPSFGGRSRGSIDLAGTGTSVAALVASLAGSGTVGVEDARLPRFDVDALSRAVNGRDESAGTIDDGAIRQAIAADLDKGALALGSVGTPATVAAGVLRGGPIAATVGPMRSSTVFSLDLRSLALSLTSTALLQAPPKDWVGSVPQVSVSWAGPFTAPAREVDATALVNGLAARAIARDQARIEAFQDDVRERAFFARRLRAIEAEQKAARDRSLAEQDAQLQKLLQSLPGQPASGPTAIAPKSSGRSASPGRPPLDLLPKAPQPVP